MKLSSVFKTASMRIPGLFITTLILLFVGCKKEETPSTSQNSLDGEWKLVMVKDKGTGDQFFKLPGTSGDVVIRFSGNNFSGHTLINNLADGEYTFVNGSELTIGSFAMTKVMEDQWGGMFLTVLQSCGLQSFSPCRSSKVSFMGNMLVIQSPLRYDLTLVRN